MQTMLKRCEHTPVDAISNQAKKKMKVTKNSIKGSSGGSTCL